ncbi:MAG: dTDP-4-dehydrorhamnose reductase [Desulfobacteraceae bacterium]|nr:dTDP-4-dehydrorhamnose reductase [Desulfobacteraceae bacterium]
MRVLVAGAGGQLGFELQRSRPLGVELLALSSGELDLTQAGAVRRRVAEERPAVIINAAAYTAVDRAESERERAFAVNGQGTANLAVAAREAGARLIHISTDFIFDGEKSSPYLPDDRPHPLGVYGASKLAGEERVREILGPATAIIRTAWVYSSHGQNFVKTMLRLLGERETLSVIADQVGTPTWARHLAQALWRMAERELTGVHHFTDAGVASWYDFAVAIQEESLALGLLGREALIRPIATGQYPLPARRPPYSVLDKTGLWQAIDWEPSHWRAALRAMLKELS